VRRVQVLCSVIHSSAMKPVSWRSTSRHRTHQANLVAAALADAEPCDAPDRGDRRSKLTQHADWIASRLAQTSELTLGEVRDELAGRGVPVSYASVWRMVRRLGLWHKKRTIFATEQDRLDVAIARGIWRAAQGISSK
jgi:hypothetical protein